MSILTKTAPALGLAAAVLSFAPSASAFPMAASSIKTVPFNATYVHDAVAGGYKTYDQCNLILQGYTDPSLSDAGVNAQPWTECWQLPSGNYTYGSIPFTSKSTPPASVHGYRKVAPIAGLKRHNSAHYASDGQCQATLDSIAANVGKNGGSIVTMNQCMTIWPDRNSDKGSYTTYGALTYSSPSYKVSSTDTSVTTPYIQNIFTFWDLGE